MTRPSMQKASGLEILSKVEHLPSRLLRAPRSLLSLSPPPCMQACLKESGRLSGSFSQNPEPPGFKVSPQQIRHYPRVLSWHSTHFALTHNRGYTS